MSRKTVPILMASVAVLFLALVVIIAMMLSTPERRDARRNRKGSVNSLLSTSGGGDAADRLNLAAIAAYISSPVAAGGSLDNLYHYLGKDPGRTDFSRSADRRRAELYLSGETGARADAYAQALAGSVAEPWAPNYLGNVLALFDEVKKDIVSISGFPADLTSLGAYHDGSPSAGERIEEAINVFGTYWIPGGESSQTYDTDRQVIRSYLLGSRKFKKRMSLVDDSWVSLAVGLYRLPENPGWITAMSYMPELADDLNELTILVLAGDLHRRSRDLMVRLEDFDSQPGDTVSPGILWMPEFSYYKNIPELTGQTADEEQIIFFAKVNLGYTFRDGRTQTWLNRRKEWLSDYFSSYFSQTVSEDFSPVLERDPELADWKTARLKAEGIHGINRHISATLPFGVKKVFGVRDLAMVRVNLLANP